MGDENSRFFQNGSLKNFDLRQICFHLVHFMIPIGSGQKCLTYDPAIVKARRAWWFLWWTFNSPDCESLVTVWTAEWFLAFVDHFVDLQTICHAELLFSLQAIEWFFTSANSFMTLQTLCHIKFLVTFGATKWFLIIVNSFMTFQITWLYETFVTLWAAEWLLTSMASFMCLRLVWAFQLGATVKYFSHFEQNQCEFFHVSLIDVTY